MSRLISAVQRWLKIQQVVPMLKSIFFLNAGLSTVK